MTEIGNKKGHNASEYRIERNVFGHAINDIYIHTHRRRNHADLDHSDDDDAEPYGIEPESRQSGRDRRDYTAGGYERIYHLWRGQRRSSIYDIPGYYSLSYCRSLSCRSVDHSASAFPVPAEPDQLVPRLISSEPLFF